MGKNMAIISKNKYNSFFVYSEMDLDEQPLLYGNAKISTL